METVINKLPEDINYMFYIKPKGAKRFSTYNPGQGTMGTGRVFTELYRKEHLQKVCDWIAEDMSGDWIYQLRSGDGKKIYWQHDPTQPATPTETPRISTETAETVNVSAEGEKEAETKENCHSDTRIVSDGYGTQYEVTRHWKNGRLESLDVIVLDTQPQTATEPPQSPEAPQIVECIADTPKPRETARKPQNRGIGNTRHSRLGANGYATLDNASATLTAMSVPRECSTADAAYW